MRQSRREFIQGVAFGALALASRNFAARAGERKPQSLKIVDVTVTPVALPDPPLLNAGGCHGPYFMRNIVQVRTDAGFVGVGETYGGAGITAALERSREVLVGEDVFAYRRLGLKLQKLGESLYPAVEVACLDAMGQATGLRVCDLLGGAVREEVEFAAYLFYKYATTHPKLLADRRIADGRRANPDKFDLWGEVRTPEAMVRLAEDWRKRWGFRVFKLKGGYLPPEVELETMRQLNAHFAGKSPLRIDPNGRWTVPTAVKIGKQMQGLPLEYYEDPVVGQTAMAEVRRETGLKMSTNMCVTRFSHVAEALKVKPVDVVLADHHYWSGLVGCQELGRIADLAGWTLSQHSNNHTGVSMAAMIHLAALVPQITLASDTHYPWLPDGFDVIQGPKLPVIGGRMKIPAGPGLGVKLDPDRLSRAHEVFRKCGMSDRDDVATMKLVEPQWNRSEKF